MPTITRLSPSVGWPGGVTSTGQTVLGTQVIIHGTEFHSTPDMDLNEVTFAGAGGARIPAPVDWASPNEIDYVPAGIVARDSTVPGGLDSPNGVAVDGNDTLFIADTGNHRIIRRTATGGFSSWGAFGSGQAQFSSPSGVGLDSAGNVYVADSGNHRIQKFDNNGVFLTSWGSQGPGIGQLDWPVDVDVMEIGAMVFVYVADSNNRRVTRTNGEGAQPTQFIAPPDAGRILGVAAPFPYGYCYATDAAKRRIYRWTWTGGQVDVFGQPYYNTDTFIDLTFPIGIAQDFDGFVYVVDQGARVVRKFDPFDPTFREITRFGLTIPSQPSPTPEDEFVDPVDIAVTDLKAAFIVDRQRKRVIRYTPTDAQEIWVHVPEGAVGGDLEVRTQDGSDRRPFSIFERADVEVADAYLTQGLVEYPLVASKRTMIRYQMRTLGATELRNFNWGSPVHDRAICSVRRDGAEIAEVPGVAQFITGTGGFLSSEIGFEILFEIPYLDLDQGGNYEFQITLERSGTPNFSDARTFNGSFAVRSSYRILNAPISHLAIDGSRVTEIGGNWVLFTPNPQNSLDWMDWQQLYSGYLHYNRLYPVRESQGDIHDYLTWIYDGMADGINDDAEAEYMLDVLERTRRRRNEEGGLTYDFMLGTVLRTEIQPDWSGITSSNTDAALISIGTNPNTGEGAFDVGHIIGHELVHQHGVEGHQTAREFAQTAKDAWNSIDNFFVGNPMTIMFSPPGDELFSVFRTDSNAFVEAKVDGADGNYDLLFDALANPHPKKYRRRERALLPGKGKGARSKGCRANFTLIGRLDRAKGFSRSDSWIGAGTTPVTPAAEDGNARLVFRDAKGSELLAWRLSVVFGLQKIKKDGRSETVRPDIALFSVTVPFPDETAQAALEFDGRPIWEREVSRAAPTVKLKTPVGGETIGAEHQLRVEWTASHPEGLELTYGLGYSADGGQTYLPLGVGLTETYYEWHAGLAAKSGSIRIRVVANDGFREASDVSGDIQVDELPTRVAIVQPRRGAIVAEGLPLRLRAMAGNVEDGGLSLTMANTIWMLDGEVELGRGNNIVAGDLDLDTPRGPLIAHLPVGTHTLQVQVTLGPGKIVVDEIPIQIAADSDRDGIPDDVEKERGTSPTDPGDGASRAPIVLFGQWSFRQRDHATVFQISHLLAGNASVEVGFFAQDGTPLAAHPVELEDDTGVTNLTTNAQGVVRVRLGSLASVRLGLGGDDKTARAFGTSYIRLAAGSPITDTMIQAHGWITHLRETQDGPRLAQGTVVIQAGRPFRLRGPLQPKAAAPKIKPVAPGYKLLGHLRWARSLARRMPRDAEGKQKRTAPE